MEHPPIYYKRKCDPEGHGFISDSVEISEQALIREIGCFFTDVVKYLELFGTVRVNEFRYWQE